MALGPVVRLTASVLGRRGLALEQGELDQIRAERDLARLESWLDAAVTCTSASELFR